MTKKIGLLFLSLFIILGFGVSFADVRYGNSHIQKQCIMFENVEIDNYRLIVGNVHWRKGWQIYEPKSEKCLYGNFCDGFECQGKSRQYLLDKSISLKDVSLDYMGNITIKGVPQKDIGDKVILVGDLDSQRYHEVDEGFGEDVYNTRYIYKRYKIVKDTDTYQLELLKELELPEYNLWDENNSELWELFSSLKEFDSISGENYNSFEYNTEGNRVARILYFWILTIIIETIILFLIAKLFWKKNGISNGKLILFGVLPSVITFPLLWFALPLLLGEGMRYTIIGEILVILIEAIIIKYGLKISRGKALITSIVCNAVSYLVGLLIL